MSLSKNYVVNSITTNKLNVRGGVIKNAGEPVDSTDVATKDYADNSAGGGGLAAFAPKNIHRGDCRAVVTVGTVPYGFFGSNNTYNPTAGTITSTVNLAFPTVDGVTLNVGDRILMSVFILGYTTAANANGIYTITDLGSGSTPWIITRASDANSVSNLTIGSYVQILEGTENSGDVYIQTTQPVDLSDAADSILYSKINLSVPSTLGLPLDISDSWLLATAGNVFTVYYKYIQLVGKHVTGVITLETDTTTDAGLQTFNSGQILLGNNYNYLPKSNIYPVVTRAAPVGYILDPNKHDARLPLKSTVLAGSLTSIEYSPLAPQPLGISYGTGASTAYLYIMLDYFI